MAAMVHWGTLVFGSESSATKSVVLIARGFLCCGLAPEMITGTDHPMQHGATPHLILIDGSGYIFRAFHALPPMNRSDGTPVNAVYGFTNMLARFLRDHIGTHIAVVFDSGRLTFRNKIYDQYKAHRPEAPPELVPQFALVRQATAAFGVASLEVPEFEADDLIATYARLAVEAGGAATIVSSDKDLMQLVGPGVVMLDPIKQKSIGPAEVQEKFGVPPNKVVEIQALMGDSTDNVPGVPGIGPKGAAELIQTFGNLEAVLAAAPSMKPSKRRDTLLQFADAARVSKRLVQLDAFAPEPLALDALLAKPLDHARLANFLAEMGFRSTAQRLGVAGAESTDTGHQVEDQAAANVAPYGGYNIIETEAELLNWVNAATRARRVALQLQTDGNTRPLRAELLGIAMAIEPGKACYLPLPCGLLTEKRLDKATVCRVLSPLLADQSVLKVIGGAKQACLTLEHEGFCVPSPCDDPFLMSYVLSTGAHDHTLAELAPRYLGHTCKTIDETTGTGRNRLSFAAVPVAAATALAAEGADVIGRLWQILRPQLREQRLLSLYENLERRLIPVLVDMEQAGIEVDEAELRRMSQDFGERMAVMETEAHRLAGHEFSLGSPKQLGEVLFDEMSLPGGKRGASGAWGTDANVLQGLAEQGHDLPVKILEWRQLAKLKSTYTEALVDEINPETGRVHTSFAMTIASTGRLSSNDPNLQNIPIRTEEGGRIRRAFIAPPGRLLVSADYSQIELRLLAHVADIEPLREAFANGEDIHARTASEVFGIPMAQMDGATRRRAKAINFGIIYGISAFGLARQLGIEPSEAGIFINAYFARYPGIRAYMERTKEAARRDGYVMTPLGRRCWISGIADKNMARRAGAERQAINAPLQGGAADIIKRAMIRLPAALRSSGLRVRLLLQVHDELLFEVDEADAPQLASLAKNVMEGAALLSVPLVVETGIGPNWAEAH